jgi:xanthine dehydrogenase iron-sulfur cluster and FAD-binding subunit A
MWFLHAPGLILAAKAFLDENSHPTSEAIRQALAGNLCRCETHNKVVVAVWDMAGVISGDYRDQKYQDSKNLHGFCECHVGSACTGWVHEDL